MDTPLTHWQLLIISLPTNSATARMRVWRALKALGCSALRDGAYLLPLSDALRQALTDLSAETVREGGNAWLLNVQPSTAEENTVYQALFNREEEYAEFLKVLAEARKSLSTAAPAELNRLLRKLRRDYDALRAIDYFPNEASNQAEAAWMDFVNLVETALSPGEPQAVQAAIPRLPIANYQSRVWATRRRLWVDRVASAWLICRFIDSSATFLWLESPAACPKDALGFDFDGATFTHIGDRVTFEVLVASFGLEEDRGLVRLGAMVHTLDIGNGFVAEAAGFEAMLAGIRQKVDEDDQLLREVSPIIDALYAHFSSEPKQGQSKGDIST
ncbi:MAG: chromate resistance protein ChrB domain-containing protein [Burkholderiaceae bacterium]